MNGKDVLELMRDGDKKPHLRNRYLYVSLDDARSLFASFNSVAIGDGCYIYGVKIIVMDGIAKPMLRYGETVK